ncbi:MAG: hypothetical protein ACI8UO_002434 [Verrucomicrobiales bacterium]|jgi:hypothetical protein
MSEENQQQQQQQVEYVSGNGGGGGKGKKVFGGLIVLAALGFGGKVAFDKIQFHKANDQMEPQSPAEVAKAFKDHAAEIASAERVLTGLNKLVSTSDWPPIDEQAIAKAVDSKGIKTLWRYDLIDGERGVFGSAYQASNLRDLLEWSKDQESADFTEEAAKEIADVVAPFNGSIVAVASFIGIVEPEIGDFAPSAKGGAKATFESGETSCAVTLVDTKTLTILAHGVARAENSDNASVDELIDDLWANTVKAIDAKITELASP